jgi:Na+/proline symporter
MRFGKISLAAIAAASLVSAPVMAESLSPAAKAVGASKVKRVGANTKEESKLGGGIGVIVAVLAAAAVIGGIVIASGNDDNSPTSP